MRLDFNIITCHVIPRMRNANFTNKRRRFWELGPINSFVMAKDRHFIFGTHNY